jgi:hypothetical protein
MFGMNYVVKFLINMIAKMNKTPFQFFSKRAILVSSISEDCIVAILAIRESNLFNADITMFAEEIFCFWFA